MRPPRKPAPGTDKAASSASRLIYDMLRERIIAMVLAPGARIVEQDIAAERGVSRTPVHEAVQRLSKEGLVEVVQRVGTFVARIPIDGLEEAMLIRGALEVAVVRHAARRAAPADLDRLRAILAVQQACAANRDLAGFHRGDEAFHAALAEIAGYPGIWRTITQAKTQVDRFRLLTLPLDGRMVDVIAEHRTVLDGLAAGDADGAADAMREHLGNVLPIVPDVHGFRPEYFASGRERR